MEHLNYVDIVLAGIVLLSALIGLARGFMREVLSLAAWVFAIYVAWMFAPQISETYITNKFIDDPSVSYLAAFGALFLVTLFAVGLLNLLIAQLLRSTGLSGLDRSLGMIFGVLRGLLIATLLVFVTNLTPAIHMNWWTNSTFVPGFTSLGGWGWKHLPPDVRQWFNQSGEQIKQAATTTIEQAQPANTLLLNGTASATRPNVTVPSQERNQISEMSASDNSSAITLESLNSDDDQAPVNTSKSITAPTNATPKSSNQPVLQLESVQ